MTTCDDIQRLVWQDDGELSEIEAHLASCPACSLESVRAHDLGSALTSLRLEFAAVPAELHASIVASLPAPMRERARNLVSHPTFLRGAAVGAAAATAAAFGLIVARRIARPDLA